MVYLVDNRVPNAPRPRPGSPRIAVVGGGIAGLGAAWQLARRAPHAAVTVFESAAQLGGHAHTVDVTLPGLDGAPCTHGVDTGFLVYNERTYPQLIKLFSSLGVSTAPSDMSFSVQASASWLGRPSRLEWSGSNLSSVFAQRRNLASPTFWSMLTQLMRFNRVATELAERGDDATLNEPLHAFLDRHGFGKPFREGYLLPMIACIWSCPMDQMLRFPVGTLIRFCHNHGLLQVENRPRWFTVDGGSRRYVDALSRHLLAAHASLRTHCPVQRVTRDEKGATVHLTHGAERFDGVVLACHAPQSLALLGEDASAGERRVLGPLRTQDNVAWLHTDEAVMPQQRRAWAAWNYERLQPETGHVCLHYWINRLQPLPFATQVFVSLNPCREPSHVSVIGRFRYAHPVFDDAAVASQRELAGIQGQRRTWFAGAWCGYGFHEDGLKAGLAAADALLDALHPGLQRAA